MTAAPIASLTNAKSKRRVTFHPFVEVLDIPRADPETKHLLWYTKCELFLISLEIKRQILIYKAISSLRKKRDALETCTDDATCNPVKRQRLLPGPILGDTTMAAGPLMPVVPVVQAAMQTAI
jgi:hypothetical protein